MPHNMDFPDDRNGKESASDAGDPQFSPGFGRSPGGGHGNLLHNSCLENPMDKRILAGHSPWGCNESDTTESM